jgi:hypothetical protein
VLEQPEPLLPLPADQVENDIVVPAAIWRYWRSHGGEAVFGLPLEPAQTTPEGLSQTFSRARLVLRQEFADTPLLVQPAPLGSARLAAEGDLSYTMATAATEQDHAQPFLPQPAPPYAPSVFFEQTGYGLIESFLRYWRSHGGAAVFGYPLSGEFEMRTADGQVRIVQYFERALFAYYPEDGSVRLEPLGQQRLMAEQVQQPWVMPQVR